MVELSIPQPGNIVLVGADPAAGNPAIWVEVYGADSVTVDRKFYIRGTGHTVDIDDVHVGSYIDGPHVWHVWERSR
jgi:hypothetical protein